MYKGKIAIIGAGFVGSATTYTLMLSGLVSELVLVDIDHKKAEGDVMDMNHGVSFCSPVTINAGSYADIAGSDMVVITAGAAQKPGESRVDLLKRNVGIFRSIVAEVCKYCDRDTVLLVVTNPVDILTHITLKLSGFDPKRVIGSGTVLDAARLQYLIGEHVSVDPRDVHCYVIGEHGDTEVVAWSLTSISGIRLDDYCSLCGRCKTKRICKEDLHNRTKNAAYEIIERKGATYYAIALAVRRIVESIIGNENSILTVSSALNGEYGIRDICVSTPTIVNKSGVSKLLEVSLSPEELCALQASAEHLKELTREVGF